jgi:integrase
MASVIKRTWTSRGPTGHKVKKVAWGYTLQVDGKQERKFSGEWTREDAQTALAARLLPVEALAPPPAVGEGITFGQAAERYLAVKVRKRSLADDRRMLEQLKAAFGTETPLVEITASRISTYRTARLSAMSRRRTAADGSARKLSAAAINRPLALLRHLLRLAHEEWEAVSTRPRIRLEQEPEGRIRWLEPDEEARLRTACRGVDTQRAAATLPPISLAELVLVALETGMRQGEILGLTWERVNLSRGVILLERTKGGRRREVPMRDVVDQLLAGKPEASRHGRVWPIRWPRDAWEAAVAEAGLEDFTFHDCRHHFASWFMMRGGSLLALREILGHRDIKLTARYAHLSPGHLRTEIEKTAAPMPASTPLGSAHDQHKVVESAARRS